MTAFATGWPENQPDIMVLSLTTHKGVQDFALSKEQALLIAKTMKETAARLATPTQGSLKPLARRKRVSCATARSMAPRNSLSALITTDCRLPRVVSERLAVKSGGAGDHLEIAVAAASLKVAVDVAAALAPGPGERAALGDDVGR